MCVERFPLLKLSGYYLADSIQNSDCSDCSDAYLNHSKQLQPHDHSVSASVNRRRFNAVAITSLSIITISAILYRLCRSSESV